MRRSGPVLESDPQGPFSRSRQAVEIVGRQPEPRKQPSWCLMAGPGDEGYICDYWEMGSEDPVIAWGQCVAWGMNPTCTQHPLPLLAGTCSPSLLAECQFGAPTERPLPSQG